MSLTPREAVDTANAAFGRHPGYRALHARGVLLRGTFTATPEAGELTRAAHMKGQPVPVTVRFSNGSGNPHQPDWMPDPRGMAVKFYLPDDSRTDIVAVTTPRFPTRTPDGFIELLRVQSSGPAAAWRMPRFLAGHPEAIRGLPVSLPSLLPPASYATATYHGQHAFKWIDGGGERFVRYTLIPDAVGSRLAPWKARRRGERYLTEEVLQRVGHGPIRFTLELQVAEAGDPVDDPSAAWPRSRRRVRAGGLELTGEEIGRETGGDVLVFDPTRVTEGIELSGDPVLRFRRDAYSESVARRTAS